MDRTSASRASSPGNSWVRTRKVSRDAWVNCLRRFKPEATDFQGYLDALQQIKATPPGDADSGESDSALSGLAEIAPLLNLGFREGTGKLTPVAVVTHATCSISGGQMNGLQLGRQWEFLAHSLGVRDEADSYAVTALGKLEGCECFFRRLSLWQSQRRTASHLEAHQARAG